MSDVVDRIDELIADEKCPHCERDWHQGVLTQKVDRMFQNGSLDPNYFAHEDTSPILCDGSTFIGPLRPEPTKPTANDWMVLGESTFTVKLWTGNWDLVGAKTGTPLDGTITFSTANSSYTVNALQSLKSSWGGYSQKWLLGADQEAPWIFPKWTLTTADPEPVCTEPAPEIDVEFGPQNWHYEFQRAPKVGKHILAPHWSWSPTPHLAKKVVDLWKTFQAIPTPASRGYDFSLFKTVELTNTGPDKGSITKGFRK